MSKINEPLSISINATLDTNEMAKQAEEIGNAFRKLSKDLKAIEKKYSEDPEALPEKKRSGVYGLDNTVVIAKAYSPIDAAMNNAAVPLSPEDYKKLYGK